MSQPPLLSVRDLAVEFTMTNSATWPWQTPDKVHAVNGVSFDLMPGKTLGIVGESGCGKSTLIRAIAGLSPPVRGTVTLAGKAVDYTSRQDVLDLRRSVQMIFQDPVASLNPRMTIHQTVEEPIRTFFPDRSAKERRQNVRELLDRVGIAERSANRYPHEFSGGQCQRIGIARALAAEPSLILCDEPVSALDVSIQAQVINLLRDLQREMGLTLIFVAHDIGIVRHISNDVLVMYLGGMMEHGPARDVVGAPHHPYTKALLSAVPVPDPDVRVIPQILEGDLPSPLKLPSGCFFQSRCVMASSQCGAARPEMRRIGPSDVACIKVEAE
ncbi:oligopeptide/dipeptide ABC transporter ATP-binding protein [Phaeobacter sp. J2-8]|uniref:ABC transporter ATP-binding protein n=1 Tax=Phaeobacter sp. J2-8 TaxID=2931394 RepID=UPI001FD2C7FF|nr:oligopeptide/dipeptide ABC transporter ATP-binding protein [Phaeobacter sp. J2-8]MCJ7872034.1 ATP-binding cassette domain-containing protein [Phaeobacter sp. J2-8]